MSHTRNKWRSVADFYNAIGFNYMLNHLNRAKKFKLRGAHYGSGHVHHVACFMCSASDFGNRICHSSFVASAIESTGSFETFLRIIKRKVVIWMQSAGLILPQKSLFWDKQNAVIRQGSHRGYSKGLFHSPSQPPSPLPWGRLLYLEPADVICNASSFLHIHVESNNFMTSHDTADSHVT